MAHKRIRFGRDKDGHGRLPVTAEVEYWKNSKEWDIQFSLGGVTPPGSFKTEKSARKAGAKLLRELADEMDPEGGERALRESGHRCKNGCDWCCPGWRDKYK